MPAAIMMWYLSNQQFKNQRGMCSNTVWKDPQDSRELIKRRSRKKTFEKSAWNRSCLLQASTLTKQTVCGDATLSTHTVETLLTHTGRVRHGSHLQVPLDVTHGAQTRPSMCLSTVYLHQFEQRGLEDDSVSEFSD